MVDEGDEEIAANLERLQERIGAACRRAGRQASEITLVAVSKTVAAERVKAAAALGVTDVGENRVQEAQAKIALLADLPLRWHMIGHLQSNKAGQAAELFHMVHSIDSVEIATHLSRRLQATGRRLPVLLEINSGGEVTKYGFSIELQSELLAAAAQIAALPGLELQGLMTVAPLVAEPAQARPYFAALRLLLERLKVELPQVGWRHLSMGMSGDVEAAIEEGATIIRLGRAIFGERRNTQ